MNIDRIIGRSGRGDDGTHWLTISDLMAGLMMIFLFIAVVFMQHLENSIGEKAKPPESNFAPPKQILIDISNKLIKQGIPIEVDDKNLVLRLQENVIRFGYSTHDDRYRASYFNTKRAFKTIEKIADVLKIVLPCYLGEDSEDCLPMYRGTLKTILIEGHSSKDSSGSTIFKGHMYQYHSILRAMTVYQDLVQNDETLNNFKNIDGQKLFAVTGYGTSRPIINNIKANSKASNKRIEFRFIMTDPKINSEVIKRIDKLGMR